MPNGRPGVYISERLLPAPIASSQTANAAGACVGTFAQGPSTLTYVNSWHQFTQLFGGYNAQYPATIGVGEFFKNGGTELYVRRILHSDAAQATALIKDASNNTISTVTANEFGSDGTNFRVTFTLSRTVGAVQYYTALITKEGSSLTPTNNADDVILEQYLNVRFDNALSPDFIDTVINSVSQYVKFNSATNAALTTPFYPVSGATTPLTGTALDGTPAVAADYTGAFNDFLVVERPLVIFLPEILNAQNLGTGGTAVQTALASWAQTNDHFAVLDTPAGNSPTQALTYATGIGATSNAAVYYPNIFIQDPLGRSSTSVRLVGPAGSVAGVYLATDASVGPFKSPAGLRAGISTAVYTERLLAPADLDALNSGNAPVNAIRNLPGANVVIMGARTLLQDGTANRYVATRRSLLFLKRQLANTTRFAIFENNDETLWSRVRTAVSVLLNDYRNQGGLRGDNPSDSFYVTCDATNNSPASIAQGIVNIEVGVALEYPAEFIQINLTQTTLS